MKYTPTLSLSRVARVSEAKDLLAEREDPRCVPPLRSFVSFVVKGCGFSDPGDHLSCAAQTGVLDEPAVGLAGWKFAAPQIVIVSDRRSRESNDPNRRSPLRPSPLPMYPTPSQFGVGLRAYHPKHPHWRGFQRFPIYWRGLGEVPGLIGF